MLGLTVFECGTEGNQTPSTSKPEETAKPAAPSPVPSLGPSTAEDAVAAGRRAVADGDFDAAQSLFARAVELAPENPRVRCEAGYVAFRAGDIDAADGTISRALLDMPFGDPVESDYRRAKAMCLFNSALVHEQRGRFVEAQEALRTSLRLRANRTVRERLGALQTSHPELRDIPSSAPDTSGCHVVQRTENCADSAGSPPCHPYETVITSFGPYEVPVPPRSNRRRTEAALASYREGINCEVGARYERGVVARVEGNCMGDGSITWEYRGCN